MNAQAENPYRRSIAVIVAGAALVSTFVANASPASADQTPSALTTTSSEPAWDLTDCAPTSLYLSPGSNANQYLLNNSQLVQDGEAKQQAGIADAEEQTFSAMAKLACTGTFQWIYEPFSAKTGAAEKQGIKITLTQAAAQHRTAEITQYIIPDRDLGGPSSGGEPTEKAYDKDVDAEAAMIKDSGATVNMVVEPDALANISRLVAQGKLKEAAMYEQMLKYALTKLEGHGIDVFLDGGHGGKTEYTSAANIAKYGYAAGVCDTQADFIFNVSNYKGLGGSAGEIAYAQEIEKNIKQIATKAGNKHCNPGAGIDTSKDGINESQNQDPPIADTAAGQQPTSVTHQMGIKKFMYVNYPGGVDKKVVYAGITYGPGGWVPANAVAIVNNPKSSFASVTNYTIPTLTATS